MRLLSWVVSAYTVGTAVGLLGAGPLVDGWGVRRAFRRSVVAYAVATAACALAPGMGTFVAARVVQGLAAGVTPASALWLALAAVLGATTRRRSTRRPDPVFTPHHLVAAPFRAGDAERLRSLLAGGPAAGAGPALADAVVLGNRIAFLLSALPEAA